MNSEMEKDILKVLVTEEELKTRIAELGEELYKRYERHPPPVSGGAEGLLHFHGGPDAGFPADVRRGVHRCQLLPEWHRVQRPGADHP